MRFAGLSRFAVVGLAVACLAAARAQEPSGFVGVPTEDNVGAWLRSGDPRLVAWGGFYAAKTHDTALIPEMVALLRQWEPMPVQSYSATKPSEPWTEAQIACRDAMGAVMAALIEMKAPVPVEALRAVAVDLPAQTVMLAGAMPPGEAEPLLLEWWRTRTEGDAPYTNSELQRVAAAMLALHPPAGFAAELMRSLDVQVQFNVYMPGAGHLGAGFGSECGVGMGVIAPRERWPLSTQYVVHESAEKDTDPILIRGVDPLRVATHLSTRNESRMTVYLSDARRAKFVAEMLGTDLKALPWRQTAPVDIDYESPAAYAAVVQAKLDAKQAAFRATLGYLQRANLMTPDEAQTAMPQLTLRVMDFRQRSIPQSTSGADALPQIAVQAANVHWADKNEGFGWVEAWK